MFDFFTSNSDFDLVLTLLLLLNLMRFETHTFGLLKLKIFYEK